MVGGTLSEIIADMIVDSDALTQFVETFTPLVDECKVHINDDGLLGRVVDPANVAMHNPVTLDTGAFESFESPGAATIGVNLNRLAERIAAAKAGDLIQLELDMETRMLNISYRNINHSIALIDPDAIRQEPDSTDPGLPNSMTATGGALSEAVDACLMVSDHVGVDSRPDEEQVVFVGDGDVDDTTVTFGHDEVVSADVAEDAFSLFSGEYVTELLDPIPKDAEVTLRFGDEFPMEWEWETSDGHQTTESMLAPRIQSD